MTGLMKLDRSMKRKHGSGGFGIEILHPGLALNDGDSGIGAIGRIDQAHITPGTVIRMHPHRDDEILTYVRRGRMLHRDTVGHAEEISSQRLMLMNAGHTFQHEEKVPTEGGVLEALQIFVRPRERDLEPMVQFREFETAVSENRWRLIAGPSDVAPLVFRAQAWVHDNRLEAGRETALPPAPTKDATRLLYVFGGRTSLGGDDSDKQVKALCLTPRNTVSRRRRTPIWCSSPPTRSAPVFAGGMFSGNILRA